MWGIHADLSRRAGSRSGVSGRAWLGALGAKDRTQRMIGLANLINTGYYDFIMLQVFIDFHTVYLGST